MSSAARSMLVESPYVGDWMGSTYTSRGQRIDYHLFLSPDGTFERITRKEPGRERVDRGRWHHKEGDEVMRLEPESPDEVDRISSDWWVRAYSQKGAVGEVSG